MTLAEAKDGDIVVVIEMTDEKVMTQGMRWGIIEGTKIEIQKNIKNGPVIISKKHIEMAIGREFAKSVIVRVENPVVDNVG